MAEIKISGLTWVLMGQYKGEFELVNTCGGIRVEKDHEDDPEGILLPVLKQFEF